MSRNNKGYKKVAKAKGFSEVRQGGGKSHNPGAKHGKSDAKRWFMGGITQAGRDAVYGKPKRKQKAAPTETAEA